MSRTSADGVDAALVRVGRRGAGLGARLEAFRSVAYPSALRKRLLQAADGLAIGAAGLAALSRAVGDHQVEAVTALCRQARIRSNDVDLVGCHGHTLHHHPDGVGVTMQIGEPALIAVRTGITTVADFRPADVAAAGQGAPLVPAAHAWLFRHARRGARCRTSAASAT